MPTDKHDPTDPFSQAFDSKFVESASVREASARQRADWAKNARRQVKISKAKRNSRATLGGYLEGVILLATLTVAIHFIRDYYFYV